MKDTTDSKFHDTGYKELFSYPEMVQALIEGFFPEEIAQLVDFDTLTPQPGNYVTPLFDEKIEDVVWSIDVNVEGQRQPIFLYLLMEFQSGVDYAMPLRFMHYVAGFYSTLIKNGKFTKSGPYPPVFPLVIYNGQARWTAKTNIADQIESVPSFLKVYQPSLNYFLVDEGRYSDEELAEIANPVSSIINIEQAKTLEDYQKAFYRAGQIIRAHPHKERLDAILTQWFKRTLHKRGVEVNIEDMMTLTRSDGMLAENFENLMMQFEQRGKLEGKLEGRLEMALKMVRRFNVSVKEAAEEACVSVKELMDYIKKHDNS
jgi:predicted transposase/invertase (TIGR01784 family)